MPKTRRSGNYVELNEARKRRKVLAEELTSDLQQSVSENRNPNYVDGGSDDSDVEESHCVYELSPYERKRLENIQRNAAMFAELNLHEAKCEFNVAVGIKRKERGLTRPRQIKPVTVKPSPLRQSLRLKRMDPEGNALLEVPTPSPQERPLNRNVQYSLSPAIRAVGLKKINSIMKSQASSYINSPRKFGPIEMTPCNDVDKTEAQEFVDELTVLGNVLQNYGEKMEKRVTSEPTVESYEKSLRRLKIKDNNVAKVVPQRIFSMAFYPAKYKTLVFAGDKGGKLGIWDVGSSKGDDGVYLYEPHSSPINCMAFDPRELGKLYSCSYDGTVRCCDANTSTFHEVYSFDKEDDTSFLYFEFGSPSASTILASTDTGNILVIDFRRKRRAISEETYSLHDTAIKCVDVHPLNCSLFVTSSRDRTVAFWDIRNLKNVNSKLSSLKYSLSVTSAYFSPLTGRQVLSTSMDDYITINEMDSSGIVSSAPKCCFRHNNHVGRWLTNFRATWDPKSDSYSVVGSMKRPRQIDIFSSEKRGFPAMQLTDEYLNSVNSLNVFHPTLNLLAGGNSSGKVYLWSE